jgi:hypothetical protein
MEIAASAKHAVDAFTAMTTKARSGDSAVLWSLLKAHEDLSLPIDITNTDETLGQRKRTYRNNILLARVFFVIHESNEKNKFFHKDNVDKFMLSALKQSIRRNYFPVAWIDRNGGSTVCAISKNCILSVPGTILYTRDELVADPQKRDQQFQLTGRDGISLTRLRKTAQRMLKQAKQEETVYNGNVPNILTADMSQLSAQLSGRVKAMNNDNLIPTDYRDALASLHADLNRLFRTTN